MRELRLIVVSNIIPFRMYSNEEILGEKKNRRHSSSRCVQFLFFLCSISNSSKQPMNEMQSKIQQNHNRIGERYARVSICVPLW